MQIFYLKTLLLLLWIMKGEKNMNISIKYKKSGSDCILIDKHSISFTELIEIGINNVSLGKASISFISILL